MDDMQDEGLHFRINLEMLTPLRFKLFFNGEAEIRE